eukprot:5697508-Amphidinium_carterae.1
MRSLLGAVRRAYRLGKHLHWPQRGLRLSGSAMIAICTACRCTFGGLFGSWGNVATPVVGKGRAHAWEETSKEVEPTLGWSTAHARWPAVGLGRMSTAAEPNSDLPDCDTSPEREASAGPEQAVDVQSTAQTDVEEEKE